MGLVAGDRRLDFGKAADRDALPLAPRAVDLHAGHARQRLRHIIIGELADVFGDDRIDNLFRCTLHVVGGFDAAPDADDDDGRVILCFGILRAAVRFLRPHAPWPAPAPAGPQTTPA